jgi:hypothetical protein
MKALLQSSTSRAEYLNGVKKHFPYEYCVRLQNWEYAASKLFPDPVEQYVSPFPDSAFRCNETITDWLGQNIYQVTPEVYSLLHPNVDAEGDLLWMHNCVHSVGSRDPCPSTYVDPAGQANPAGLAAWDDTTTI